MRSFIGNLLSDPRVTWLTLPSPEQAPKLLRREYLRGTVYQRRSVCVRLPGRGRKASSDQNTRAASSARPNATSRAWLCSRIQSRRQLDADRSPLLRGAMDSKDGPDQSCLLTQTQLQFYVSSSYQHPRFRTPSPIMRAAHV